MRELTVQEWQLLSFFEVESSLLDPAVPWCYNDAAYEIERGDLMLTVAIAPAYHDVRIVLKQQDKRIYELNALDVEDVRHIQDGSAEFLEIVLSPKEAIVLRVKPTIEIEHRYRGRSIE